MSTSTLPLIDEFRSTLQSTGVHSRVHRLALWVALPLAALVAGCGEDDNSDGGLAVIVETDLSLPKDLDKLTFEVWQNGVKLRGDGEVYSLGKDQLLIPAEFRVKPLGDTSKPVLIRAIGWKGLAKRVERSVITTVPSKYLAMVRLPLSYLCVGKARDDGSSTCGEGQTCRLGLCDSAQLDPTTLPTYEKGPWTGAEMSTRDPSLHDCFDVVTCFAQGSRVTLDRDACTFTLDTEDTSNISIGIKLPRGSDGICGAGWCWIALDEGAEGWSQQAGLFTLPRALCLDASDGSRLTLIATNTCGSKTPYTPSCDEGSAAAHPSDTSETIGVTTSGVMETPGDPIGPSCAGLSFQECGNCGQQRRTCRNGSWDAWGECVGEGICPPNSSESCGAGGMRICSNTCEWGDCTGETCPGAAVEACGNCGTRRRTCTNGEWSVWGICEEEGECEPNTTRACADGGTQACLGSCKWGTCGTNACPGAPEQACGNCGTQSRECDATTMTWSAFGACGQEGACEANQTRTCGSSGIQTCAGDCQWDAACVGQMCEGPASQPCGRCGIQTRTCDSATGGWSTWSECRNEGVCAPMSAEECGAGGSRVCLNSCQWSDECIGQSCDGAMTQSCGFCGTESRICDGTTGQWLPSLCASQGPCNPGSTRRCGTNNTGTRVCTPECQWDLECTGQACPGSSTQPCGNCGTETRTCDGTTGQWQGGACLNESVVCTRGREVSCGTHKVSRCSDTCEVGPCVCDAVTTMVNGECRCSATGPRDGCCPPGVGEKDDPDCPAICGNGGAAERGELCDPPGSNCAACNDNNSCTRDRIGADCKTCENPTIAPDRTVKDNVCCPVGANSNVDADCAPPPPECGDGKLDPGEKCDASNAPCAMCNDNNDCTTDTTASDCKMCTNVTIAPNRTTRDGVCCPAGATSNIDADCPPVPAECNDGKLDPGEKCDVSNASCAACDDNNDCTTDTTANDCKMCRNVTIASNRTTRDGVCCPAGSTSNVDADCPPPPAECDDGKLDPGEKCDTSNAPCAMCDDNNDCTTDTTANDCKMCRNVTIAPNRTTRDGVCCPAGSNSTVDADCPAPPAECDDGKLDPGEKCDTSNASCAECDDNNDCTTDTTASDCKMCRNVTIAPNRTTRDGVCCPAGSNSTVDADCPAPPAECDDGKLDPGEKCDTSNASCAACNDNDACTTDTTANDCKVCRNATIASNRTVRDGACCPAGSTSDVDADCPDPEPPPPPQPVCGNNIVEAGEQCDPPNGETCDANCRQITPADPSE